MCWKQAIIIKESTTIKERSDVYWNKCMDAHPAKARLSKKAQGIFLLLESNWGARGGILPKLAGEPGSVIHVVVALE